MRAINFSTYSYHEESDNCGCNTFEERIWGVLVFASAQDPNHHHYIIAVGVLDGENDVSWGWFFEKRLSVVPDTLKLLFISDRNSSLIKGIRIVYSTAHHEYYI